MAEAKVFIGKGLRATLIVDHVEDDLYVFTVCGQSTVGRFKDGDLKLEKKVPWLPEAIQSAQRVLHRLFATAQMERMKQQGITTVQDFLADVDKKKADVTITEGATP
ncbi:MAG: hypothetical protein A2Y38_17435 [Spirochaetes bacterium GWB1_59_5]|nr:MAG: hypothetical protein A2Y38_17435 [Spirochaetes bacterium GWB1_59_5]